MSIFMEIQAKNCFGGTFYALEGDAHTGGELGSSGGLLGEVTQGSCQVSALLQFFASKLLILLDYKVFLR